VLSVALPILILVIAAVARMRILPSDAN